VSTYLSIKVGENNIFDLCAGKVFISFKWNALWEREFQEPVRNMTTNVSKRFYE